MGKRAGDYVGSSWKIESSWKAESFWEFESFCKVRRSEPFMRLIKEGKMSGSYFTQNSKKNVHRRICSSSSDVGNKAPPRAINDASRALRRQQQLWEAPDGAPTCVN